MTTWLKSRLSKRSTSWRGSVRGGEGWTGDKRTHLSVLGGLLELHVVLLEAVEGELGRLVDVDLEGIVHELVDDGLDGVAEGGTEHEHLLVVGRGPEHLLHIPAHVQLLQHAVALVQHEVLHLVQLEVALLDQSQQPARRADDNVGRVVLEHLLVGLDGHAPVDDLHLDGRHVLFEAAKLVENLIGQLARVAHDNGVDFSVHGLDLLQDGDDEHRRLAHAALGLADDVRPQDGLRDALVLHLRRVLEAAVADGVEQLGLQQELPKARSMHATERVSVTDVSQRNRGKQCNTCNTRHSSRGEKAGTSAWR